MKNKFIKKIFNIALVCVFAIQLVGCGNNNNKIDMTKLEKTMMAADTDMPTMLAVNSDSDNTMFHSLLSIPPSHNFHHLSGIDSRLKYYSMLLHTPTSGLG